MSNQSPDKDQWESRIRRVLGGEYPKQVWDGFDPMQADLRLAMTALDLARLDAADMRGKVASSLDTILTETSNMTVGLARSIEHMRSKIREDRSK